MGWWGKIVGGAFGFMLGGPLGAVLGAALGHNLDRGYEQLKLAGPASQERIQTAFFTATFTIMGRVAKADGRVSEDEIAFARAVMQSMRLDEAQREVAMRLFNEGKDPGFELDASLDQFRKECHRRSTLMRVFLEIQLQAAYADGVLSDGERELLVHVFERLGFSEDEFDHLEAVVRGASTFSGAGGGGKDPKQRLREAYEVLGVSEEASDAEVKKAYRRLMAQHHPDKLVAKGLPQEMMDVAKEKTQEIRAAYDTIQEARSGR